MEPKFIFVSGGVLSGLGKGITAASLARLLKSRGFAVSAVKCDMYLNIDAGTMNPVEHGEVFVTEDGLETDQDLGHYERFLDQDLSRANYITAGMIYQEVLGKERNLEYGGQSVEAYKHIPEEIIGRLQRAAQETAAEILLVELGGTVGEYQNIMFFEAVRRMKLRSPRGVLLVHVGYLPTPQHLGEMKSKPLQQSVLELNRLGLHPDFIVGRSEKVIDEKRKEKIALASGLEARDIFANPDVESIYEVPLVLETQGVTERLLDRLGLEPRQEDLREWRDLVASIKVAKKPLRIGMVAKYIATGDFTLEDAYICVNEAVRHAAWQRGFEPELVWFDSQSLEGESEKGLEAELGHLDGLIVPQGWGSRGVEGKIRAVRFARERGMPYLGLCFGMQMATIEFARHAAGLEGANSTEVDPDAAHPVIHIMPDQREYLAKRQYGGTIRLGAWPCRLAEGSFLRSLYREYGKLEGEVVQERHRHRYELNNDYRERLEAAGLIISGTSPDGRLVEAVELPRQDHPFFVGTQFHPEIKTRPLRPHPIFLGFVLACANGRR